MFMIVLGPRGVDDLWSSETCGGWRWHSVSDARSKTFYEACSMWSKILTIQFQEHSKALLMMFLVLILFLSYCNDRQLHYHNILLYQCICLLILIIAIGFSAFVRFVSTPYPAHTVSDIGRTTLEDAFIQMVDASKNASSHTKKDPLPTITIVAGPLEETMGPSLTRWRVQSWKHGQTNMLNISCHQPISVPVIDGIFFYALAGRRHSSGRSSVIRWYQRSLFISLIIIIAFQMSPKAILGTQMPEKPLPARYLVYLIYAKHKIMLYLVSELGGFRFHSELHPISGTMWNSRIVLPSFFPHPEALPETVVPKNPWESERERFTESYRYHFEALQAIQPRPEAPCLLS